MRTKTRLLITQLAIPLGVGGLSALVTRGGMKRFAALNQPPLSPPGWLFPVVWTILFAAMGYAAYLICMSGRRQARNAMRPYWLQLAFNFLWSVLFFNLAKYLAAFLWLIALWILILITSVRFGRIRKEAGWLLVPYLAWVAFAGYLNFGVYLLN